MLTVNIDDAVVEERIKSLAAAHGRNPNDIVMGALATSMGVPELLMSLHFSQFNEDPMEYIQPVAIPA